MSKPASKNKSYFIGIHVHHVDMVSSGRIEMLEFMCMFSTWPVEISQVNRQAKSNRGLENPLT